VNSCLPSPRQPEIGIMSSEDIDKEI
jgi:hypothetical protein